MIHLGRPVPYDVVERESEMVFILDDVPPTGEPTGLEVVKGRGLELHYANGASIRFSSPHPRVADLAGAMPTRVVSSLPTTVSHRGVLTGPFHLYADDAERLEEFEERPFARLLSNLQRHVVALAGGGFGDGHPLGLCRGGHPFISLPCDRQWLSSHSVSLSVEASFLDEPRLVHHADADVARSVEAAFQRVATRRSPSSRRRSQIALVVEPNK